MDDSPKNKNRTGFQESVIVKKRPRCLTQRRKVAKTPRKRKKLCDLRALYG
jgi:hypothetical protein